MNLTNAKKPLLVLGGALTGMTAAYVLTKPKLRRDLAKAAKSEAAARAMADVVGTHLHRDAKQVTKALRKTARKPAMRRVSRAVLSPLRWAGGITGKAAQLLHNSLDTDVHTSKHVAKHETTTS